MRSCESKSNAREVVHVSTKRDVIISAPLTTYRPLTSLVRVYILIYNIFYKLNSSYNYTETNYLSTNLYFCLFRNLLNIFWGFDCPLGIVANMWCFDQMTGIYEINNEISRLLLRLVLLIYRTKLGHVLSNKKSRFLIQITFLSLLYKYHHFPAWPLESTH